MSGLKDLVLGTFPPLPYGSTERNQATGGNDPLPDDVSASTGIANVDVLADGPPFNDDERLPCYTEIHDGPERLRVYDDTEILLNKCHRPAHVLVINIHEKDPQDVLARLLEHYQATVNYYLSVWKFQTAVREFQGARYRTRLRPAMGIEPITNFRAYFTDSTPGTLPPQIMFTLYYPVPEYLRTIYRVGLRTSHLEQPPNEVMALPIIDRALILYQMSLNRIILTEDSTKGKRSWADLLDDNCVGNLQTLADRACRWWDGILNAIELGAEELITARSCHESPRLVKRFPNLRQEEIWESLSVLQVCLRDCLTCMESNQDTMEMIRKLTTPNIALATTDVLGHALKRGYSIDSGLKQDMDLAWHRYQATKDFDDIWVSTNTLKITFYSHQSIQTCTVLILIFLPSVLISSIFSTGMLHNLELDQIWIMFTIIVGVAFITGSVNSLWSRWYSGFGPMQRSKFVTPNT